MIDYQSKLPFYEQIANRYQMLILRGILPAGTQMPSVRSLAVELSINPNTIQKAYSLLEQQGYIYSAKGRGSFVSDVSDLAEKKKKTLIQEVRGKLKLGKELGVTEEEFIALIRELYSGSGHSM